MEHRFLFKVALSSVPPVRFLSSGHCVVNGTFKFLMSGRLTYHAPGKPFLKCMAMEPAILSLRNFVKFCGKCPSPFT